MSRFLALTIFLMIVIGALIHFQVEVPYVTAWIGQLPGDLLLRKGKVVIYLPFASSLAVSLAFTFVSSLFTKR